MKNQIAKTIARLRMERGLSQEQLAQQLHVTRQTISSWETGRTTPDPDTLEMFSSLFEVPLDELFYGEMFEDPAKKHRPLPKIA